MGTKEIMATIILILLCLVIAVAITPTDDEA
jgi:hypothetical protein